MEVGGESGDDGDGGDEEEVMTGWPGDYVLVMMVNGVVVVEARGVKVEGGVMLGMMGITGVGADGDKRGWGWWGWGIMMAMGR